MCDVSDRSIENAVITRQRNAGRGQQGQAVCMLAVDIVKCVLATYLALLLRGAVAVELLAAASFVTEAVDFAVARRATISAEGSMRCAASYESAIQRGICDVVFWCSVSPPPGACQ